jgi:hypothetical protein
MKWMKPGFLHCLLLWGLTLFTVRRLWLHSFHTILGSHSVYQLTIVASYISYYCGVSLYLPVDDCGFIHFILLWGLTLFTGRRLWLHTFHTIVGSHCLPVDDCGFIHWYYCGVSLCLPVDDCGFIHFILLLGLTLFTSRRLWLHSFYTIVGSHSVYQ